MIEPDLRPLGAGEILDRAVTLFVRRFLPFVLILALIVIPISILSYFAQPDIYKVFGDLQRYATVPPGHAAEQRAILEQITAHSQSSPLSLLAILLALLIGPLATTACTIAVARAYRGSFVSVGVAYREAVGRWFAQILTALVFFAIYIGMVVALGLLVFAVALLVVALLAVSRPAGLAIGIPLGVVLAVAFIGALMLLYLAWQLAVISISVEEPDPARAIGHSIRRTLAKPIFWRSLLVALIVLIVHLVGSVVLLSLGGLLSALTHVAALIPITASVGGVVLQALIICYLVVYSYDVRVRREGYDLAIAT